MTLSVVGSNVSVSTRSQPFWKDISKLTLATELLHQQLYVIGRDIESKHGNLLMAYGAKKTCAPDGCAVSLYSFRLAGGYRLALRGFGVFIALNRIGGLFMHRYHVKPRWMPTARFEPIAYVNTHAHPWLQILLTTKQGDFGYGLLNMGPFLFVWALPTVLLFSVILAVYKATGLVDRMNWALHPLMRPLGLSGRDAVRVLMGFGCNVPAVISTRACSGCSRGQAMSAIAFGAACSYQLPATLAVLAAAATATKTSAAWLTFVFLAYAILFSLVLAWGGRYFL